MPVDPQACRKGRVLVRQVRWAPLDEARDGVGWSRPREDVPRRDQEYTLNPITVLKNLGAAAALVLVAACATAPAKPPVAAYSPNYSYKTKTPAAPNSAGVTIAIVAAEWGKDSEEVMAGLPELQKFNDAVASSVAELATAKGMTIKGPFKDFDEMTYSDKKGSALALVPKFSFKTPHSIRLLSSSCGKNACPDSFLPSFTYAVELGTTGSAVLRIMEPQSGEFLWQKNVPTSSPGLVKWQATTREPVDTSMPPARYLSNDQEHTNQYLKVLESHYMDIMSALDKYLTADEMQSLQKASAEIKAKKVY